MQRGSQKNSITNEKRIKDIILSTAGDNYLTQHVQQKDKNLNNIEVQKPESILPNSQVKNYNIKLKL